MLTNLHALSFYDTLLSGTIPSELGRLESLGTKQHTARMSAVKATEMIPPSCSLFPSIHRVPWFPYYRVFRWGSDSREETGGELTYGNQRLEKYETLLHHGHISYWVDSKRSWNLVQGVSSLSVPPLHPEATPHAAF
jgi:hypothetical protein